MAGARIPKPEGYVRQEPTLRTYSGPFGREPLELTRWGAPWGDFYRKMDNLTEDERRAWYLGTLGKYDDQLRESARSNHIPVELLVTILLDELADLNVLNWMQHECISYLSSGSLGMGQIQVSTALKHGLFKGILDDPYSTKSAHDVAQLLAVPQYSIEATAREIRHLLDVMEQDPTLPLPSRFSFVPPSPGDWDPHRYYAPGAIRTREANSGNADAEQVDREASLAHMVASAYNGGDKFISKPPSPGTSNSEIHGLNAEFIARDLFSMRLFRSPSFRSYKTSEVSGPPPIVKHNVVAGDTLAKLAEKYYAEARFWPILYAANRNSIGNDPNMLKVGLELRIPDLRELSPSEIARVMGSPPAAPNTISMPPLR